MRYIVSVVEGYATPVHGGVARNSLEASVLDSYDCFRQVSVFPTGNQVNAERTVQRANWHCEELNEQEDRWEAA